MYSYDLPCKESKLFLKMWNWVYIFVAVLIENVYLKIYI